MSHVSTASIEHVAMSVSLRAPRVAIVVPTTENWHFIAATAIHRATQIWGGAGFILVPHERGVVNDLMLRTAVAYDPDHVVTIHDASIADLIEAGACEWTFSEGDPDPSDLRRKGDPTMALSPHDDAAREKVSGACTPYRYGVQGDKEAHDDLFYLEGSSVLGSSLLQVDPEGPDDTPKHSANDPETRDVALMRANRFGMLTPPDPTLVEGDSDADQDDEGVVGVGDGRSGSFGDWASPKSAWRTGLVGLTSVATPIAEPTDWVVIGDTFNDYALSYALERLEGRSIWIPSAWLSPNSKMNRYIYRLCSRLFWRASGSKIVVVSTSIDADQLNSLAERLTPLGGGLGGATRASLTVVKPYQIDFGEGNQHLALSRDYDHELVVPVRRDAVDEETVVLVNPLPAIVPETDFKSVGVPAWHVDVDPRSGSLPGGRGLAWSSLQANDSGRWPERARSGRDGVSVASGSFGLVLAGSSLRQRLARPILRFPSAMSWVRAMAGHDDYDASVSTAGHKAKIAAEIWGGRDAMAASMTAGMPLFNEFMCSKERTRDRYPDGDGCVIRGEGFLTFDALRRVVNQTSDDDLAQLRTTVDELDSLGVIRRGMIFGCPSCTHVQWVPASQITTATCSRCQAGIPLNRASWKYPVEEPLWFYDLHPVVRDVIAECGHVAILGGRHLQRDLRGGSTVLPDIEFKRSGDHFEIDLVVTSRRKVAVGECKNRPEIPRDEVTKKLHALVQSAVVLRADEIVLAAGQPGTWDIRFVTKLAERVAGTAWIAGKPPRIRLLTDVLGDVKDQYHEPNPGVAGSGVANG